VQLSLCSHHLPALISIFCQTCLAGLAAHIGMGWDACSPVCTRARDSVCCSSLFFLQFSSQELEAFNFLVHLILILFCDHEYNKLKEIDPAILGVISFSPHHHSANKAGAVLKQDL
jgi:hypothetical protein